MKLHFDSKQEFQLEAVKAITALFEGQPLSSGDFEFSISQPGALLTENGFGNKLTLTEEQILENVKAIQQSNGLKVDDALKYMKPELPSPNGEGQGVRFEIPDMLAYIQSKTELTRSTILEILKNSKRLKELLLNPQLFMDNAVSKIREELHQLMIDGIKYEKIGGKIYEMTLFDDSDFEIYIDNFTHEVGKTQATDEDKQKAREKTIYENYIPLDSNVESQFAKDCETSNDIEFYFKLPFWFKINTPIGTYNPDWAVVFKGEKRIYFVAETKGKDEELRPTAKMKIHCGKEHFEQFDEVKFIGPISSVTELNN